MQRKPLTFLILTLLVGVCGFVWWAVMSAQRTDTLTLAFLDVGQGDSIFIESPAGVQVLIDGGPSRAVLRELATVMPFYDRSIDVLIATHPDADHISGLVDVLQRYEVAMLLRPGVQHDTPATESLFIAAAAEYKRHKGHVSFREVLARRGQVIDIGGGAYIHILFPDREVNAMDPNAASVVARLVYGDASVMLTGDAPDEIEKYLVSLDGTTLKSDILKLGHHGSKTSSAESFLGYVSPQWGIVSAGADNRYGHPHKEVISRAKRLGIAIKNTADEGSIVFESDGQQWSLK